MAILIADGDCIIYEIPRTGTTWMRHALTVLGVGWEPAVAVPGVCNRHALPEHYLGDYSLRVCVLRDPLEWLRSYWSFHHGTILSNWKDNMHYPHRMFGPPVEDQFADMVTRIIETNPCSVTRYFKATSRHCNLTLDHSTLNDDLHALLLRCGYDVDIDEVRKIPPRNLSPDRDDASSLSSELEAEFRKCALQGELIL